MGIRPVEESRWAFSVGDSELGYLEKVRLEGLGQVGVGPECQPQKGKEETKIIMSLLCIRFFHVGRVA